MDELSKLAERVERDDCEIEGILYHAWGAICDRDASFRRTADRGAQRFTRLVTAGAYLDAAMMLVPWGLSHMEVYTPDHQSLGWTVHLIPARREPVPFRQASGFALKHEAALTSAALRARSLTTASDGEPS